MMSKDDETQPARRVFDVEVRATDRVNAVPFVLQTQALAKTMGEVADVNKVITGGVGAQLRGAFEPSRALAKAIGEVADINKVITGGVGAQLRAAFEPSRALAASYEVLTRGIGSQLKAATEPSRAFANVMAEAASLNAVSTKMAIMFAHEKTPYPPTLPGSPIVEVANPISEPMAPTVISSREKASPLDHELWYKLRELGPKYAEMYEGAWDALLGGRPDGLRHAAHSARELIDWTLRRLAPDAVFIQERGTSQDGRPTRRMRALFVLNLQPSDEVFVAAIGDALTRTHKQLAKVAHVGESDKNALMRLLHACEAVLLLMLSSVRRR